MTGNINTHVDIGSVVLIIDTSPRTMLKLSVTEDMLTGLDELFRAAKIRQSIGLITTWPIV